MSEVKNKPECSESRNIEDIKSEVIAVNSRAEPDGTLQVEGSSDKGEARRPLTSPVLCSFSLLAYQSDSVHPPLIPSPSTP